MVKKIKIESLPKGSTFMHTDGKIGIIASINSMGARVRYKGKKRCVTISSSSPVIPHSSDKPTWVYNDGGRKKAGYKKLYVGDCVCRSICIATGLPYKEVYKALAEGRANQRRSTRKRKGFTYRVGKLSRSAQKGLDTKRKWFKDYMKELGFKWTPTLVVGKPGRVCLNSSELPGGTIICKVKRHYVCVIDGVINDTYDCSEFGTKVVHGYWHK